MEIRKYNSADKTEVLNIFRLNIPNYFSSTEEEGLIEYLEKDTDNYYVLLIDNNIVGAGGFNLNDDKKSAVLAWDFFHPQYQGKGLGTALTDFRIKQIKEIKSVTTIIVRTAQFTYRFYGKVGFILREVIKDYWAEGYDLYSMEINNTI